MRWRPACSAVLLLVCIAMQLLVFFLLCFEVIKFLHHTQSSMCMCQLVSHFFLHVHVVLLSSDFLLAPLLARLHVFVAFRLVFVSSMFAANLDASDRARVASEAASLGQEFNELSSRIAASREVSFFTSLLLA